MNDLQSYKYPEFNEDFEGMIPDGGSALPEVTASDNGKVLSVVNGTWDKATPSGGAEPFLVMFSGGGDYGTPACDKTYLEIVGAYNAGKEIKIMWTDGTHQLECLADIETKTPTQFDPFPIAWIYARSIFFDAMSNGFVIKQCRMNMSVTSVDDIPLS